MNNHLANIRVQCGNHEAFRSLSPWQELYMPSMIQEDDDEGWCCMDEALFPLASYPKMDESLVSSKDLDDCLKLLGDAKDSFTACIQAGICFAPYRRNMGPSVPESSWIIQILDRDYTAGDILCFKLYPAGSQACMLLEGAEVLESVETLSSMDGSAHDGEQLFFNVHMTHDDLTERMDQCEAMDFLRRVLQCMREEMHDRAVAETSGRQTQQSDRSLVDENVPRPNRVRMPRFRRLFRKAKISSGQKR